ncbi:hypothetical protein K5X82_00250 [Halosquirtibacter xylanolyticus]|uniref:hypothetical protein n=1 Tax=Halosquirtibacter xylanolyticus TaxID=3374599 RepID=UPI0037495EA3|nr:hypothetical protein K5X82_00250 [Prolixibacteraceae bacterium]
MKKRLKRLVYVVLTLMIFLLCDGNVFSQETTTTAPPASNAVSTPTLVLESGTVIPIKLSSMLVASGSQPGTKFAGVVSMDVIASDGSVLPQNCKVQGVIVSAKKGGRLAGSAEIVLKLTFIQYEKKYHPVTTFALALSTEKAGKETIRKAGAGAAIGAAFNGGTGAGRGAAVMGGLQLLSHNGDMKVPAGYVLNFKLDKELKF